MLFLTAIFLITADTSPTTAVSGGSLQSLNMDAMLRYTFMPDYSVRASTEVFYLKIRRQLYLAAKRATLMERSHQPNNSMITPGDQFDDEVEKVLVFFSLTAFMHEITFIVF